MNNTKFIRDLDAAFSKLSKLRDPQTASSDHDPFENTSLTRSSLEASLGLGRLGRFGGNKGGPQQLSASEAMERHRNRLKDKEIIIEKVKAIEAKIRQRKGEIRGVVESNESMKNELDKQAQWRDMLGI